MLPIFVFLLLLLFFSLTLGVFRTFPRTRNQRCRQLIHSSLIRINGRQKTIMAGMLNALLPDGGKLPISMAMLTGVAITKEGKALADRQITFLWFCASFACLCCFHFFLHCLLCSDYEDLLCRNITQWFESEDVVEVCYVKPFFIGEWGFA